jgi:hypothetical protein
MATKSRFFAVIGLLLSALVGVPTQGAITYSEWYAAIGNNTVHFPDHTTSPNQVTMNWGAGTFGHDGGGGEFRVESVFNPNPGAPVITYTAQGIDRIFKTFCLEQNEHISLGTAYDISTDPAAYYGANNAPQGNHDDLDITTQILYGRYFDGTLDEVGTGFAYDSDASANALQRAIWAIEDNVTPPAVLGSDLFSKLYFYATGASADSSVVDMYKDRVGVMNLWVPNTFGAAQSQLMWLEEPTTRGSLVTPEPASLVIWGLGLAAGVGYRWRKQRSVAQ